MGIRQLQVKGCLEPPKAGQYKEGFFPRTLGGSRALPAFPFSSVYRLWVNTLLLFEATKFMVIWYNSPTTQIHQLYNKFLVWCWASLSIFLNISFIIYKLPVIILISSTLWGPNAISHENSPNPVSGIEAFNTYQIPFQPWPTPFHRWHFSLKCLSSSKCLWNQEPFPEEFSVL